MQKKEIQRGDLFYYDFGKREGSVQSGERPVMVIQADNFNANAPTIIVAAVTAVMKKKYLPSHIILGEDFGLKKPSMVLLEQIQTVNKDELTDYIGSVNDERLWKQINAALKKTFGYDIPLWCKPNLSIEEAAAYSGIGMGKLYEMTESQDCPFVLWIGSRRMIKRKVFDEFIERQYSI